MAVLLITYDLNKESKRPRIVQKIKKLWPSSVKLSESSYAVKANQLPKTVYQKLEDMIDDDDDLHIITLQRPAYCWGQEDVNEWLDENLP